MLSMDSSRGRPLPIMEDRESQNSTISSLVHLGLEQVVKDIREDEFLLPDT